MPGEERCSRWCKFEPERPVKQKDADANTQEAEALRKFGEAGISTYQPHGGQITTEST